VIREFRDFLFRGNIIDLAVALVLGLAFSAIVTSLVEDIITPLLGLVGIPDFSSWTIVIGDPAEPTSEIRIGQFLNTLISFIVIAAAIFLLVVKPMQRVLAMRRPDETVLGPTEIELLTEIRDELRRQPRVADTGPVGQGPSA
jgi:large conductance mechanosensitive channel